MNATAAASTGSVNSLFVFMVPVSFPVFSRFFVYRDYTTSAFPRKCIQVRAVCRFLPFTGEQSFPEKKKGTRRSRQGALSVFPVFRTVRYYCIRP